jgi:uncharacterized RDD family membrane protein YckC
MPVPLPGVDPAPVAEARQRSNTPVPPAQVVEARPQRSNTPFPPVPVVAAAPAMAPAAQQTEDALYPPPSTLAPHAESAPPAMLAVPAREIGQPMALMQPMAELAPYTEPMADAPYPLPPPMARTPIPGFPHPPPPQEPRATPQISRPRREAAAVHVVGFWRRVAAAVIDLAIVVPAALIVAALAGWVTGVHLPGNLSVVDIDLWIDLVLATDPALVMGLVLFGAIGLTYLLVFQIVVGRTLGMRVLGIKIIDVYGDRPSAARCVARCAGYLAGIATLFLGFLWMGFDSEKRGLQDWIAGTYVIRA